MNQQTTSWLLANARSGSNSAAAIAALEEQLIERGMPVARRIDFPDEQIPDPELLDENGVDKLIVFTGDGTLNAAITGLAGWGGKVLVLPGGTMNLLSCRLHGDGATSELILDRVAAGAMKPVRPLAASCEAGTALAGLLVGPGTAWATVREAMRDYDLVGFAQGAGEAVTETASGARVRVCEPQAGQGDGYPLLEITPSHRGMVVDGYRSDGAGDMLQHSWALLRRRFREGPHERLGIVDRILVENCEGEPIDVLIDGEPRRLGPRAQFTVAACEVDLLATDHGF